MARYTRQQLREDKFAEAAAQSVSFFTEHEKPVAVAATAILVVLALLGGGWFWLQRRDSRASIAFGAALRDFQAPLRAPGTPAPAEYTTFTSMKERGAKAYAEFSAITRDYSYTRTAKLAQYFAGLAAVEAGLNTDAEKDLQAVASSRDKDLASLARMALASLYRSTGRPLDAMKIYNDLVQHPTDTVPKSAAELELAGLYQAQQQPAEAQRIYEQIRKEDPTSPAAQIAGQHLAPAP